MCHVGDGDVRRSDQGVILRLGVVPVKRGVRMSVRSVLRGLVMGFSACELGAGESPGGACTESYLTGQLVVWFDFDGTRLYLAYFHLNMEAMGSITWVSLWLGRSPGDIAQAKTSKNGGGVPAALGAPACLRCLRCLEFSYCNVFFRCELLHTHYVRSISGLPSSRQLVLIFFPLYAGPVISGQHPEILAKSLFLHVPRVNPVILQPCHDAFPILSNWATLQDEYLHVRKLFEPLQWF